MAFTRVAASMATMLCVANLHASAARESAERELIVAARAAHRVGAGAPLVLGGDFNLRPALSGHVFERLTAEFGLAAPTGSGSSTICSLAGSRSPSRRAQWPPERREVPDPTASGTGRCRSGSPTTPRSRPASPDEAPRWQSGGGRSARSTAVPYFGCTS